MWQTITTIAGGAIALILAWVRLGGKSSRLRSRIARDLELLEKLEKVPGAGTSTEKLSNHVNSTVERLVDFETHNDARKTDWSGIGAVLLIITVAAGLGVFLYRTELLIYLEIALWAFFVFLITFAMAGLVLSVRKAPEKAPDDAG